MKRLLTTLTMFLLFVCVAMAGRGGMVYENFHVEAFVHKNNVWDITETIDVEFFEPRHGIYRHIPQEYYLKKNFPYDISGDEPKQRFVADIDLEDVNVEYEKEFKDDNLLIKMGSADREIMGKHRYVIKYVYKYPSDRNGSWDYLFHSILGEHFEDSIRHFSFKVTFEKPLPQQSVDSMFIFSGVGGNQDESQAIKTLEWDVEGNSVIGAAEGIAPYNAITLFTEFPEGYYEDVNVVTDSMMKTFFYISMLLILVIAVSLLRLSRPHITKNVQFYPPEDISSAEVGTVIDGTVDTIDLASLVPWFASKGYIKIEETMEKGFFGKKKVIVLTKLCDLPQDAPTYQKTFMRVLFSGSTTSVRLDEIGKCPSLVSSAQASLESLFTGEKGSDTDRTLTRMSSLIWLYVLLVITTTLAIVLSTPIALFDIMTMILTALSWTVPFSVAIYLNLKWNKRAHVWALWKKGGLMLFRAIAFFLLLILQKFCLEEEFESFMPIYMLLAMAVPSFLLVEFVGRLNVDTPWRADMMGKLLGLKEFIDTAERQQLEQLQDDDPEYFYRLIPYAIVFGLTKRWAKQFDGFLKEPPSWYVTDTAGGMVSAYGFASICNSISSDINRISIPESSSSSGSSGGGGFSGGGGGGGGGGSW